MALDITVKGKPVETKFSYRKFFKANQQFETTNTETGEGNKDGAVQLFMNIAQQKDDDALIDFLQLSAEGKATQNDVFKGIEDYVEEYDGDEKEAYNNLFDGIKEEMLASGFFVGKIETFLKNMEQGLEIMQRRDPEDENGEQATIKETMNRLRSEIY